MGFDFWTALWAGLIAGVVMVAARLALRAAGMNLRMNVALMWSTMFHVRGPAGPVFGMAVHLVVSVGIGLVYAWGFANLFPATDALWLWGVLGAAIHWILAGVFLAVAPAMNPEMPGEVPVPGVFAWKLGRADVIGFAIGHLAYGVAFGVLYASLHPAGGIGAAF